ncbi:hypothetical protein ZWY2020_036777 [Hordeum vulgare]|nr:hypothetical protein ZWY2020_036777 [Hordeum vulgare]
MYLYATWSDWMRPTGSTRRTGEGPSSMTAPCFPIAHETADTASANSNKLDAKFSQLPRRRHTGKILIKVIYFLAKTA